MGVNIPPAEMWRTKSEAKAILKRFFKDPEGFLMEASWWDLKALHDDARRKFQQASPGSEAQGKFLQRMSDCVSLAAAKGLL